MTISLHIHQWKRRKNQATEKRFRNETDTFHSFSRRPHLHGVDRNLYPSRFKEGCQLERWTRFCSVSSINRRLLNTAFRPPSVSLCVCVYVYVHVSSSRCRDRRCRLHRAVYSQGLHWVLLSFTGILLSFPRCETDHSASLIPLFVSNSFLSFFCDLFVVLWCGVSPEGENNKRNLTTREKYKVPAILIVPQLKSQCFSLNLIYSP